MNLPATQGSADDCNKARPVVQAVARRPAAGGSQCFHTTTGHLCRNPAWLLL